MAGPITRTDRRGNCGLSLRKHHDTVLIHPGEHLADELKAIGISANELARQIAVPTNRLTQIIAGKRGISGDTAFASAVGSAPARTFG